MYFAYFDESGDNGNVKAGSPTRTFTLACILVHDKDWLRALDEVAKWRREVVKPKFRLPVTAELKSNWLIHNKSPAIRNAKLSFKDRLEVFRSAMQFMRDAKVFKVFGVVIVKIRLNPGQDARDYAWRYALQRLERFGKDPKIKENVHVIPDEGHSQFIRKEIRKIRRFSRPGSAFGKGTLDRKADNIVEDPSERNSRESFFIQLADLAAYSAFRGVDAGKHFKSDVWDLLADARLEEVNSITKSGPPGIVVWPTRK